MVTVYSGLVGWWRFDGSAADPSVVDSSRFNVPATLTDALQGQAGGISGLAMRPSLATGKMVAPYSPFLSPRPRVSVSVWAKLDMGLDAMWGTPVFADKTNGTTGYFLGCLTPGSADVSFRVFNGAGTPYTATYTETATSGWIHYVGVYEGSVVRLYRNGVSVATAVADGTFTENLADLNNVGLGFQGLIDELTVWSRMLTGGEVAALYNGGAGLAIVPPVVDTGAPGALPLGEVSVLRQVVDLSPVDAPDLPAAVEPDKVPFSASLTTGLQLMMSMLASPYFVVDSPRRIFIDPHPNIVSVSVDENHLITAVANGGPTDATAVSTWWQIEITPGIVVVVADLEAGQQFKVNHNQTDTWSVPLGETWNGRTIRFFMQPAEDAAQTWHSAPVTLSDPNFNNGITPAPSPLPPGPPLGPTAGPTRGLPGPGVWRNPVRDFSRR